MPAVRPGSARCARADRRLARRLSGAGVHHEFKYLFVARHGEALVAVGAVARARRFLLRPRRAVFAAAADAAVARLFAVRAGADAGVVGEFRLFKGAGVGFQGDFAAVRQGA